MGELTYGTYRVLDQLGEGGMGVVYVAEHTLLGRRAAIKVLLPELSADKNIVNRFFNEARAVTTISDPGIVQVFDFGYHGETGSAYIVMELLEGESLGARLRRVHQLSVYDALRITLQMARSLAAAHAKGIVHRDLKPDNVFLCGDPAVTGGERAKILDFGIAKLATNNPAQKTQTSLLMGTPTYMSPEQCRGAGEVDHRSDIYSLGCMLFQMIVGRTPFVYEATGELIAAHLREPPPMPSSFAPELPSEVDALVMLCLEKRADDRFQSMTALADAITAIERKLGVDVLARHTPVTMSDQLQRAVITASGQRTPTPAPVGTPTTLQTSSGQVATGSSLQAPSTQPPTATKRKGMMIGIGVGVVAIAGIVIVAVSAGGGKPTEAAKSGSTDTPSGSAAAAATPTPTPTPTPPTPTPPTPTPPTPPTPTPTTDVAGAGSASGTDATGSASSDTKTAETTADTKTADTKTGTSKTGSTKATTATRKPRPTGGSNDSSKAGSSTGIDRGD